MEGVGGMVSVDQAPTASLSRAMEPANEVPGEVLLEVTGTLPQALRGTLYRNGPARWEAGGFSAGHLFDGDGLISRFVIDDGQVRFRSRYIRTPKFRAEEAGRGGRVRGLYTQAEGGPLRNAGRMPADCANTHAVAHADRLLALSDAGRPWQIDPDDLSTVGVCDFDGSLPRLSRFSPHPKIDPLTGELFNFGLDLTPRAGLPAGLRCYRVDTAGRLHVDGVIGLDHVIIQHDFAITEHYLVFALAPIIVDPARAALALLGLRDHGGAAGYREDAGMRIVLVPRGGGPQRVIECDPLMYVHVNNAYEDGDDVVLDVVRHRSFDLLSVELRSFRDHIPETGTPVRMRITRTGRVLLEEFDLASVEFPMHDERRTGRAHRYGYFAGYHTTTGQGSIAKIDHHTGWTRRHVFDGDTFPGEPVFVPRSATAAEDDGWLLAVTYLVAEHRTALVVLDASDIERPPVAVARLDRHFMPGFHGSFTDRVSPPQVRP